MLEFSGPNSETEAELTESNILATGLQNTSGSSTLNSVKLLANASHVGRGAGCALLHCVIEAGKGAAGQISETLADSYSGHCQRRKSNELHVGDVDKSRLQVIDEVIG